RKRMRLVSRLNDEDLGKGMKIILSSAVQSSQIADEIREIKHPTQRYLRILKLLLKNSGSSRSLSRWPRAVGCPSASDCWVSQPADNPALACKQRGQDSANIGP
ncbi:MAG: hypothetical protein ACC652_11955, partial [Acidimicrobiales bacterium]